MRTDPIRGKTLRWSYADGPMAGKKFEHTFAPDGTVTYRTIGSHEKAKPDKGDKKEQVEKTRYEVARINDDVYAVSYLSSSGFTLTSVLDAEAGTVVSFASNEKQLMVQHGTFETVKRAA